RLAAGLRHPAVPRAAARIADLSGAECAGRIDGRPDSCSAGAVEHHTGRTGGHRATSAASAERAARLAAAGHRSRAPGEAVAGPATTEGPRRHTGLGNTGAVADGIPPHP